MLITPAELGDIALLVQYDLESNQTAWNYQEYLESFQNNKIYVAKMNDIIVGAIVLRTVIDQMEILQFWIRREYQYRGFGTMFLNWLIDFARGDDIKVLNLEVRVNNEVAVAMYKKFGFIIANVRRQYYDGQDAFTMVRSC